MSNEQELNEVRGERQNLGHSFSDRSTPNGSPKSSFSSLVDLGHFKEKKSLDFMWISAK